MECKKCSETHCYITSTSEAGNAYPSGAPAFTSGFHRGSCCPAICISLFHVIVLSFGLFLLFDCLVSIICTYITPEVLFPVRSQQRCKQSTNIMILQYQIFLFF